MEIKVKSHGIEAHLLIENQNCGLKLHLQDDQAKHHEDYTVSYSLLQHSVTSFDLSIILDDMMYDLAKQVTND